jgi:coenzyme F420-0:L-glutamate ligase
MSGAEPTAPDGMPAAGHGLTVLGIHGLPDIRPGDDLVTLITDAADRQGGLRDGDVLVVTSKVVSKSEGRLVPSPADPERRDALRRRLIDEQTVRLVAQMGRTKIVENRLGLVAAAAGIDASNVHADEIALLPEDPDASAEAMVLALARRGVRVGVVITDTQGRAWRNGVIDVAIGAAGVRVVDDHRGGVDAFGNELVVTQVAIGDEIAAAADLVKGKLAGVPVAVVRGLEAPGLGLAAPWAGPTSGAAAGAPPEGTGDPGREGAGDPLRGGGRALIRPAQQDLFRLGTDLAIELGRRDALPEVPAGHDRLHADVRAVLHSWSPPSIAQATIREAFLGLLAARPDATSRSCLPGHVTASVIVLSADRERVLLTLHPRVGRWLQVGGHCEGEDGTVAAAALREATEESGIAGLELVGGPVHLDIHPITCSLGVPTRHYDVRFVALAPAGAVPVLSAESRDLRWWPVDGLPPESAAELGETIAAAVRVTEAPVASPPAEPPDPEPPAR